MKNRADAVEYLLGSHYPAGDFSLFTLHFSLIIIHFLSPLTYRNTAIGRCDALSGEAEEGFVFAGVIIFLDICLDIADARSDGFTAFQFHAVIEETAILAVSGHGERDDISTLFQF